MEGGNFKFRTEFQIEHPPFTISLKDKLLLAGSCFADVVGEQLRQRKFDVLLNPFGNIYNPHSLFKLLIHSIENKQEEDHSFIHNGSCYFNYDYHSEVFADSKEELQNKIRQIKSGVREFLKKSKILVLTLGTAFIYRDISSDQVVANCHKVPQKHFKKQLLSPKDLIDDFEKLLESIISINPEIKIILTVSPVRHIKDTVPLNTVSKSVLRLGIHYICETFPNTYYFPSYELLMDDLRDYRFYNEDLIHPSEFAERYVWEMFAKTCLDNDTRAFIDEFEKVKRALNHKPFNPTSKEHQKFLKDTLSKAQLLHKKVDLSDEINYINRNIL